MYNLLQNQFKYVIYQKDCIFNTTLIKFAKNFEDAYEYATLLPTQ